MNIVKTKTLVCLGISLSCTGLQAWFLGHKACSVTDDSHLNGHHPAFFPGLCSSALFPLLRSWPGSRPTVQQCLSPSGHLRDKHTIYFLFCFMGILVPATTSVNGQNLFPLPQESKQNICHQLEVITLQNIPVLTNILALTATIFLEGLVHLYT